MVVGGGASELPAEGTASKFTPRFMPDEDGTPGRLMFSVGGGGIRSESVRIRGIAGVSLAGREVLIRCALFRAGKAGGTSLSSLSDGDSALTVSVSSSSSVVMNAPGGDEIVESGFWMVGTACCGADSQLRIYDAIQTVF